MFFYITKHEIIRRVRRSKSFTLFGINIHFDYVVHRYDSPLNSWVIFRLKKEIVFPDCPFDINPVIVSATQKCEDFTYVKGKRICAIRKTSIGSCKISQCLQIAGSPFSFFWSKNFHVHPSVSSSTKQRQFVSWNSRRSISDRKTSPTEHIPWKYGSSTRSKSLAGH